tara:strand:+ start:548 stop:784 length:237 start_codon:yes stop_codon:yes gene_type:complete
MNKEELINRHAKSLKNQVGTSLAIEECIHIMECVINETINNIRYCKSDSDKLKCSGCKKPLNDGLCGNCCSSLASGMY